MARYAPKFATTDEVSAASGISRVSLWRWVRLGLLPEPTRISDGRASGVRSRWPGWAVERAAWIRARRDEKLTLDEVAELIRQGEAPGDETTGAS